MQRQQRELENYRQKENKKIRSETYVLHEIGKLKKLDLIKLLTNNKRRNYESSDENEGEEEEEIEEKKPKTKKKRKKSA